MTEIDPPSERNVADSITATQVMYGLHVLAPFTMLVLAVVALLIGMVKRDDVRGTWLDTHYAWLSSTFWWGLLAWIVAWGAFWLLTLVTLGLGMVVAWIFPGLVFVWYLYRVIKGWLRLNDRKPIE